MASGANPILNSIFRAWQIRGMLENQKRGQQREDRQQRKDEEDERRKEAAQQRQEALDMLAAEEKARTLREKLEASGGFKIRPENQGRFEGALAGGEDFSVPLSSGVATTASAGRLEKVGDERYFVPERQGAEQAKFSTDLEQKLATDQAVGAQNLQQRLEQEKALEAIKPPVLSFDRFTDDAGNRVERRLNKSGQELGRSNVGKVRAPGAVTPRQLEADARARRGEERSERGEGRSERSTLRTERAEVRNLRREGEKLDLEAKETVAEIKALRADLQKKTASTLGFGGGDPAIAGEERAAVEQEHQALLKKLKAQRMMRERIAAELAELEGSPEGTPKLRGSGGGKLSKTPKDPLGIR